MKKRFFIYLVTSLSLLLVGMATVSNAQDKAGTSAAPELLIPVGARNVALSGASISSASGLDAIFWNPAGLDAADYSSSAMFSHRSYIADIGINSFAAATRLSGFGSVALTLRSFVIGNINVTTEDNPDGNGQIINPTFFVLGLTYSKKLTDRIGIGVTFNVVNEAFGSVSASGMTIDAGVQYQNFANLKGLSLGVSVKNIGTSMQFGGSGLWVQATDPNLQRGVTYYKVEAASSQMPTVIDLGLGYTTSLTENIDLSLNGAYENNTYGIDQYRFGVEVSLIKGFFVRGGYLYSKNQTGTTSIFQNYTLGLGVNLAELTGIGISLDYAYVPVQYFSANNLFDIRLDF